MKRQIEPYDRKLFTQAHFHVYTKHLSFQNSLTPFSPFFSPIRLQPNNTTYSYLGAAQDTGFSMKRQIEPYDRKKSAPAHFHVYTNPDGTRPSSRARNAYRDALWGRSRSHSRTGKNKTKTNFSPQLA